MKGEYQNKALIDEPFYSQSWSGNNQYGRRKFLGQIIAGTVIGIPGLVSIIKDQREEAQNLSNPNFYQESKDTNKLISRPMKHLFELSSIIPGAGIILFSTFNQGFRQEFYNKHFLKQVDKHYQNFINALEIYENITFSGIDKQENLINNSSIKAYTSPKFDSNLLGKFNHPEKMEDIFNSLDVISEYGTDKFASIAKKLKTKLLGYQHEQNLKNQNESS